MIVFTLLLSLASCREHPADTGRPYHDFASPELTFNKAKDSVYVHIPEHTFQDINLVTGVDSLGIISGRPGKFIVGHIRSSLAVKINPDMYVGDKIDGAFQCWDSINDVYYWQPFYHLYKKP